MRGLNSETDGYYPSPNLSAVVSMSSNLGHGESGLKHGSTKVLSVVKV
jgi:hypothetical protein